jgi:hypothetical protein
MRAKQHQRRRAWDKLALQNTPTRVEKTIAKKQRKLMEDQSHKLHRKGTQASNQDL